VTPDDVLTVLRPIYARGKRSMADHVRCNIRAAFSWALKSGTRLSKFGAAAVQSHVKSCGDHTD
jgi:hypothetical protein